MRPIFNGLEKPLRAFIVDFEGCTLARQRRQTAKRLLVSVRCAKSPSWYLQQEVPISNIRIPYREPKSLIWSSVLNFLTSSFLQFLLPIAYTAAIRYFSTALRSRHTLSYATKCRPRKPDGVQWDNDPHIPCLISEQARNTRAAP